MCGYLAAGPFLAVSIVYVTQIIPIIIATEPGTHFFSFSFSLSSFLFQTMSISMYFGVSWLDPRIKINDTANEWREVKTGPKDVSAINYRWQAKTLALDRHQLSLKYSGNGLPDFFFRK